jgi:twitching motility protein PilU
MSLRPLFKLMAKKQASDLFFTAGAPVQMKILGNTLPLNNQVLEPETIRDIAYELMSEAQAQRFEAEMEMNLALGVSDTGSFRVNIFRQRGSLAMVIRHVKAKIPSIDELKLPPLLKELIMEKRGLILIVGSTGSGKSTTLAAMIEHRNSTRSGHILTIEDPLEYLFEHRKGIVNQREIGMDTHSYEHALSNAMREAPDVLMIGEIRDQSTLRHALIYAQTGHLCLSTLHANNTYHALNRIFSFFPPEARGALVADLSLSLKAVISQRLIKGIDGNLVPAVEVLINSAHIAELIKNGKIDQIKEAMEQSLSPGSQSFEQALFKLYRSGQISLDDALAHADSPSNLSWIIDNAKERDVAVEAAAPTLKSDDLGGFNFNHRGSMKGVDMGDSQHF